MAAVVCAFLNYPALLVVGPVALGQAGAEASRAGVLTALFSGATVATELSMPWLLARVPGTRVLVGALTLMTLGSFASLPVVHSATGLLVLAPLRGVGFGATVVTIAVLAAELAPATRRAESLGYLGLASSIPNVVGPSLGLVLAGVFGVSAVFLLASLATLAGVILALGIRPLPAAPPAGPRRPRQGLPRQLTVPFLALTLLATSYGGIVSYGALVLPSAGLASATLFFLVYGSARGLGRWLGGVSCPRFGVRNVTLAGLALAPGALLLLVLGMHDASPPLAGLVYGAGSGLAQSAILVGMLDRANSADVRLGSTMWNLALDLGVSLGGAGLALVAAGFGMDAVLWTLPVLAGAGLAVYVFGLAGSPRAVLAGATTLTSRPGDEL
ncbi:MAG: MFS transporter [Chloroflexi bacterium]|nr:MFS transporter [Chloroflexota bacterium]